MVKDNNKNKFNVKARELGLSRSAKKRASRDLQKLGGELCRLGAEERKKLPLAADIQEALEVLDRINDREGRRRQIKFIGALLRETEPEPIADALANIKNTHAQDVLLFQQAEDWRQKLLECPRGEEKNMVADLYNSCKTANGGDAAKAPEEGEFLETLTRARDAKNAQGGNNPNYGKILFGMITRLLGRE